MRRRLLVTVVLAMTACNPAPDAAPAGEPAEDLRVGLTDFAISVSAGGVAAGEVDLQVTNAGATAHDLRIEGETLTVAIPTLEPGATTTTTVDTAGSPTLTLWCTLPGHRRQGMETTIDVAT